LDFAQIDVATPSNQHTATGRVALSDRRRSRQLAYLLKAEGELLAGELHRLLLLLL